MDDDMLAQLIADFGARCGYRRAFADSANPAGWVGPGPVVATRPVGTRDAGWDATERAVTDSTLDAGTGYAGGYAPAVNVAVLLLPSAKDADAPIAPYGLALDEDNRDGLFLASQMTPTRGDLLIDPAGVHYAVGARVRVYGAPNAPLAYRVALQRRQPGDVTLAY